MGIQSLRSFRLVCQPGQVPDVESLLRAQGFVFEEEPFYPLARRLLHEPIPLGASLAARFGYIYIQDRSSMLPPLALLPGRGASVLDMCASPGSKTGMLAGLVGQGGFVLGNEPSRKRLGTLRSNLKQQNLLCCGTCSYPGEHLPLPEASAEGQERAGWDWVQLDPPCSGWGTVEKNPQAVRIWQGDKIKPLVALQRQLLAEAARLLLPGGRLAYSTCTTNERENEDQVRFAVEELGFDLCPLPDPPGFCLAPATLPGVWRIEPGEDGQGFFVALLQKKGTGGTASAAGEAGSLERPEWHVLSPGLLDSACLDSARLPEGLIAEFSGTLHFIPASALRLLPADFVWKGFPVGRMDRDGRVRSDAFLRTLIPSAEEVRTRGGAGIGFDEAEPIVRLIGGQSLEVKAGSGETALYYRELPLCRLTVKGRRAVLPQL